MADGKTEAHEQTRGEKIALLVINQMVSEYEALLEAGTAPDVPVWLADHQDLYDKFGADLARPIQGAWLIHERKRLLAVGVRSLREYALAVVEGADEQEAFDRGRRGEGTPLHDMLPDAPLFDVLYVRHKEGLVRYPFPAAEWIRGLFAEHDGWRRCDPTGISDRILDESSRRVAKHGVQWMNWPEAREWGLVDEALAWCEGVEGVGGRLPLGSDPDFARPCVQAYGLMLLGDMVPKVLGVLDLPPKDGRRRFLFFGMRSVP